MPSPVPIRAKTGFSLVELSIVILILGLLVGGVVAGTSLVKSAELRSVTNDIAKYRTAVQAFRDKYNALPGDMLDATTYWGAAHATHATCKTTVGSGTATCNGDGNDSIITYSDSGTWYETFRAWQHLANAGLIEGSYSGVTGSGGSINARIGTNVPASRVTGAGYTMYNLRNWSGDTYLYDGEYGHVIYFGAQTATDVTVGAILKNQDALKIDSKSDDGKPSTGNIVTYKPVSPYNTNCVNNSSMTASYLTIDGGACVLIFKTGF